MTLSTYYRLTRVSVGLALFSSIFFTVEAYAASAGNKPNKIAKAHKPVMATRSESIRITRSGIHSRTLKTTSPVSVVTSKELANTGQPTLRDALNVLVPSLTVPTGGFDAGGMTDSISLRGLDANQTLILVDGQRRHSTANIYADGGPNIGTTPVDIDMIPMSMVDHVEIMRDGAALQYGADGIAGIVNIILKKSNHGMEMRSDSGITSNGDGFQQGLYLDGGTKLGNRGWIHWGGDFVHNDHAFRSAPDARTGTTINKVLSAPEQTRESAAINMGFKFSKALNFYGDFTYAHRHAEAFQNYRMPAGLMDNNLNNSPYSQLYPDGYSPIETLEEQDFGVNVGFKGVIRNWDWDFGTTYGRDFDNIGLKDSANFSLAKATGRTPTTFNKVQAYSDTEWNTHFDLKHDFHPFFWPYKVKFSGGASYRYEQYGIGTGSSNSLYGGGSDALAGTIAANAGHFSRDVVSGYVDLQTKLNANWKVEAAGRTEHYTDVGTSYTGRVMTRYDFSPRLAFRGSIGTNYKAPTLAQKNYSSVNIEPTIIQGTIRSPNGSIKGEQSFSFDGGFIFNPIKKMHITVEAYQINLRGRIAPGGNIYGAQACQLLGGYGLGGACSTDAQANPDNVSVNWYSNVANTRTRGLDISASYQAPIKRRYGTLNLDLAVNLNQTQLRGMASNPGHPGVPVLNAQSIAYLTTAYPRSKIILGGNWQSRNRKWNVSIHEIRWGEVTSQLSSYKVPYYNSRQSGVSGYTPFINKPKWTTNIAVTYHVNKQWYFRLGGNNIFANYPSRVSESHRYYGVPQYYLSTSQLGLQGGYYYFDVGAKF